MFRKKKIPAVFLHTQKTAGSSIVGLAIRHYKKENSITHGDYLEAINHFPLKGKFLINEQIINKFHSVPFVSGHFGYDFAKQFMQTRYSFTFLRDPIERVLSFYYFCKGRNPNQYEIYRICQQSSLDEFLQMGLELAEVKIFIWNNQVWQLACGFGNRDNLDLSSFRPEDLLDLATRNLEAFSHIGFVETFEKDRDKILKDLGIRPPKEKIISNVNPGRPTSKDLSRSTLNLLEEYTQLDQALYQRAWSRRDSTIMKNFKRWQHLGTTKLKPHSK